jgi:DNA-binding helix-hairpin-helix protein with protein kinase domain
VPTQLTLTDDRGKTIALGPAFASGGEGAIHPVIGNPTLVAKVYKKPPTKQTSEKLRLMLTLATPGVRSIAAWPSGLLMQNGSAVGFLMPRIERFEPAQHLYNPAQRLKYFSRFGWAFVLHTARNCAAAFDEVHKTGCLVGDVNQSNVLINDQGLARLIDCDSFQVSVGGKHFLCEVGVAHYTPPELQGQNFRSVVRTLNHDRFGLAVLMFQFLYVGRHPYAGVFLGRGDLAFEDAIREFRFAYGPRSRSVQRDPPPFTPTLADVPPELGSLFCRAFERGSESPNARPTALEWLNALGRLSSQVYTCSSEPGHQCWSGASGCVWCRIANSRGPDYFFGVGDSPTSFSVDETRLGPYLARLSVARLLNFPYDRDSYAPADPPEPEPPPENLDTHKAMTAILAMVTGLGVVLTLLGFVSRAALLIGILVTLVFGIWLWLTVANSPFRRELVRRRVTMRSAKRELERLEDWWDDLVRKYARQHDGVTRRIRDTVARCRHLPQEYQIERNSLEARREELARVQHLKSCFISDADILNVKEGRKQMLAAYNILTAYDIDLASVMQIKGFGQKLAGNLVAWRDDMNRQFRFDKSKGVPETELRGLAVKYRKQQEAYFRDIEHALGDLERLEPKVRKDLGALVPELTIAVAEWLQADEDVRILRRS